MILQATISRVGFVPLVLLILGLGGGFAQAESYRDIQNRSPELFHEETGLRISKQRAQSPEDIPLPARKVDASEVADLIKQGAIALDVFGASELRYDELDGTWQFKQGRQSVPGAIWLPETGRCALQDDIKNYLFKNLDQLTNGDKSRGIIVFCVANCWMSWNGAQRIASAGYQAVYWFPEGADGWREEGLSLEPITPTPVDVD
ncbi:MAG: rhodanese-like domain-containing protein [Hyphomicrobiales bacterium]